MFDSWRCRRPWRERGPYNMSFDRFRDLRLGDLAVRNTHRVVLESYLFLSVLHEVSFGLRYFVVLFFFIFPGHFKQIWREGTVVGGSGKGPRTTGSALAPPGRSFIYLPFFILGSSLLSFSFAFLIFFSFYLFFSSLPHHHPHSPSLPLFLASHYHHLHRRPLIFLKKPHR